MGGLGDIIKVQEFLDPENGGIDREENPKQKFARGRAGRMIQASGKVGTFDAEPKRES